MDARVEPGHDDGGNIEPYAAILKSRMKSLKARSLS